MHVATYDTGEHLTSLTSPLAEVRSGGVEWPLPVSRERNGSHLPLNLYGGHLLRGEVCVGP